MPKEEKECINFAKELENLKKEYAPMQKKYSLPEYAKLAEDFDIDRAVYRETSFILRDIRKFIADKMSSYLNLFETLVNPSAPPVFVFIMLKNLEPEDAKEMKECYNILSKMQVKFIKTDISYNEKREAEIINLAFKEWQGIKPRILALIEKFEKKIENPENHNSKAYFG